MQRKLRGNVQGLLGGGETQQGDEGERLHGGGHREGAANRERSSCQVYCMVKINMFSFGDGVE